MLALSWWLLN